MRTTINFCFDGSMQKASHGRRIIPATAWAIISCFVTSIAFGQAQDGGSRVVWESPIQLSCDSVPSTTPRLALSRNTIHVIWFGIDTIGNSNNDGIQYAHSSDQGSSFSPQTTIAQYESVFGPGFIACTERSVSVVYFGLVNDVHGMVIVRSTDDGNTWFPPRLLLSQSAPQVVVAADSVVYIHYFNQRTRNYGLLRSGNDGLNWTMRTTNMPQLSDAVCTATELHGVGPVEGLGHYEVGYYTSYDFGKTWAGPEIVSREDAIPSLKARIAVNNLGMLVVVWNEGGSVVSRRGIGFNEDGDIIWDEEKTLSQGSEAVFTDVADDGPYVVAVWDDAGDTTGGVHTSSSSDDAESFGNADQSSLGNVAGEPSVALQGKTVHLTFGEQIGGNAEIFYRRGIVQESLPKQFILAQNFPNPFNGTTRIVYDLPYDVHVSLHVYNILGQRITTLVDDNQTARRYEVILDGNRLATGVYFYQLVTPSSRQTKKLVVVR